MLASENSLKTPELIAGSTVMFSNSTSRYAKWFFGQIGTVVSARNGSCRVRWNDPVEYHNMKASISDFEQHNFTVIC